MESESQFNENVINQRIDLNENSGYCFTPTNSQKNHNEKIHLQRRLAEIEKATGNEEQKKQAISLEIERRKIKFQQIKRQKALSNQILKRQLGQETCIDMRGKVTYGY